MTDKSVLQAEADSPTATLQTLRQEHQEIGANLRHYANLQFAQLSIAIVVAGGIATAMATWPQENLPLVRLMLCIVGVVTTASFLAMSLRVSDYWDKNVGRAREVEAVLGMRTYLIQSPSPRLTTNRTAVAIVYWTLIASFGLLAVLFGSVCIAKIAALWSWGA